jgi:CRISPR-associated endonuclease/helicase Cas3
MKEDCYKLGKKKFKKSNHNDQKEHGEDLEYFDITSKVVGKKERYYMICKIDYNNKIGFNFGKKAQCTSNDNIF